MTSTETELTIKTNNVPRDIVEAYELTAAERAEFDYIDWHKIEAGEDSASFFRYGGEVYDLGEFMRWDGVEFSPLATWDGYQSDSFFSGLLVRYVDDFERVIVARYYS
jgi:hypothetical protein